MNVQKPKDYIQVERWLNESRNWIDKKMNVQFLGRRMLWRQGESRSDEDEQSLHVSLLSWYRYLSVRYTFLETFRLREFPHQQGISKKRSLILFRLLYCCFSLLDRVWQTTKNTHTTTLRLRPSTIYETLIKNTN